MEKEEKIALILAGIGIGIGIGVIIYLTVITIIDWDHLYISKELLDDICFELTGEENSKASIYYEKLICKIPNPNESKNIIIRKE